MKRSLIILTLAVLLTAIGTGLACLHLIDGDESDPPSARGSIDSGVLGERRDYLVRLPASYERAPTRRYPVVYVLDGSSQDVHTAKAAALMASVEFVPEVIVVGIPNLDGDSRQRDFTPPGMRQDVEVADSPEGRADRFLEFMRAELMPEIDQRFRTTSERVLAGNSRGGLFVIYALAADPSRFQAYVANSPAMWRDDAEMVKRLQRALAANRALQASLFLSLGSDENDKMKSAFRATVRALQQHAPAGLRWHWQLTPGAKHGSNAALATPVGLRWSFDRAWQPRAK